MAKTWKEVRAEAVRTGRLDEVTVAVHRERLTNEVRAHKLAEVRRTQQLTQVEVAEAMKVTPSRGEPAREGRARHHRARHPSGSTSRPSVATCVS